MKDHSCLAQGNVRILLRMYGNYGWSRDLQHDTVASTTKPIYAWWKGLVLDCGLTLDGNLAVKASYRVSTYLDNVIDHELKVRRYNQSHDVSTVLHRHPWVINRNEA